MELVDAGFPVRIPAVVAAAEPELLSQGAEALVFKTNAHEIVKFRPVKSWRLPELDTQLRKRRTTQEARVLDKLLANGVMVPRLLRSEPVNGLLYLEIIEGDSLKKFTWDRAIGDSEVLRMYAKYGELVAKMHAIQVCHGDLTTSNAMVRGDELVLIDFGLSQQQASVEDKAVDLYVLERAIQSTHPLEASMLLNEIFMPAYSRAAEELKDKFRDDVLERLQVVRQRGRKRTQLG